MSVSWSARHKSVSWQNWFQTLDWRRNDFHIIQTWQLRIYHWKIRHGGHPLLYITLHAVFSLLWRHTRFTVCPAIANRMFVQKHLPANNKGDTKSPHYWPFVREIQRWPLDSPHKGSVLWQACRDVIIFWSTWTCKWCFVLIYKGDCVCIGSPFNGAGACLHLLHICQKHVLFSNITKSYELKLQRHIYSWATHFHIWFAVLLNVDLSLDATRNTRDTNQPIVEDYDELIKRWEWTLSWGI